MCDDKLWDKIGQIRIFPNASIVNKNESTHHKNMVRHEVNDGKSIGAVRYLVRMGQHGEKNDLRII